MAPKALADDGDESMYDQTVQDFERGCGSMDHDATYLRADVGKMGTLPVFVEFETPIPYREGHFRTFKRVNGTEMLLESAYGTDDTQITQEIPEREAIEHVKRASADVPGGEQAGALRSMQAQDLMMHVGKSHYGSAEEFVTEAKLQGVNKKIPASSNQEPPQINPGRTRLFIVHPRAIPTGKDENGEPLEIDDEDDDKADWDDQVFVSGLIGYSYLTRAIHTADVEGEHPEWVNDLAESRDDFDAVDIGDHVPRDSPEHPENDEDDMGGFEAADPEPVEQQPSAADEAERSRAGVSGDPTPDAEYRDEPPEHDPEEAESDDESGAGEDEGKATEDEETDESADADGESEPQGINDAWSLDGRADWSDHFETIANEYLQNDKFDDFTPEVVASWELSAADYQRKKSFASALDMLGGNALDANPSGDELDEALACVPVLRGSNDDGDECLVAEIDGAQYTIEDINEINIEGGEAKIPLVNAKGRMLDATERLD